jgi:hypothetical protein
LSPPRKSPPTQPDWVVQARFSSRLSWLPHEILTQDVVFVLLVSTMNVRGIAVSGDCVSRVTSFPNLCREQCWPSAVLHDHGRQDMIGPSTRRCASPCDPPLSDFLPGHVNNLPPRAVPAVYRPCSMFIHQLQTSLDVDGHPMIWAVCLPSYTLWLHCRPRCLCHNRTAALLLQQHFCMR